MLKQFRTWLNGLAGQRENQGADESIRSANTGAPNTVPDPAPTDFANSHNGFALSLYQQLSQRSGNVFFSPLSIRVVCAMACSGAKGDTATQMREVLQLSSADSSGQSVFSTLVSRLAAGNRFYDLDLANALWSQAGAALEPDFVELMSRVYSGHIRDADFSGGDFEAARAGINGWVRQKTNQRIQELIPRGSVDADTRMVLVNAVYFNGKWVKPFENAVTRDAPFYPQTGGPVRVPLMYQREKIRYMQTSDYQAVDLDYARGDLSMLVLLPEEHKLRELEDRLSESMIESCVKQLDVCDVKLFLPRFRMTRSTELSPQLGAMGMPKAFARGVADFSGINGLEPPDPESLYISSVFHQAVVEVNEEGTEAVAATSLPINWDSAQTPPVYEFRADHSFLFAIREKRSNAILFLGRLDNPLQDS